MAVIRRKLTDIRASKPKADLDRIRATSDDAIDAMIAADPDTAPDLSNRPMPAEPRALRAAAGMTQEAFAGILEVPVATLRNWEQHRTPPEPAAKTLFRLLALDFDRIMSLLKQSARSDQT